MYAEEQIKSFGHVRKGTWVRFLKAGCPAIGQVEYVTRDFQGRVYLITDVGIVDPESVLEYRNADETHQ